MSCFTEYETFFCERICELTVCNHFSDERLPIMRDLLGANYCDSGDRWHWQWQSTAEDDENIEALGELCAKVFSGLFERLRTGAVPSEREAGQYVRLTWWNLYHRYRDALHSHSVEERKRGEALPCRALYQKFEADYTAAVGVNESVARLAPPPEHVFSLYYQTRRAFSHIFFYMIGGSEVAGKLRCGVWESIFTHDRDRYLRVLYNRMNNFPTLITGETGTGKELIARAIACSRYIPYNQAAGAFEECFASLIQPLNLTALSPTLLESELFGHRRGSFTGAISDRKGYLESCSPLGTVFLDEIGELEATLQVKILRVLEDRSFNCIGDVNQRSFKGKIIAATNRDLDNETETGGFRTDLYYRLCADLVRAPSLREQLRNAPGELRNAIYFIARRETNDKEAESVTELTMNYVNASLGADYPWPGNFRELGQCVRNVIIRNEYRPLRRTGKSGSIRETFVEAASTGTIPVADLLRYYCSIVHAETNNYLETARRLGIDHRTVRKHLDPELIEKLKAER